MQRAHGQTSGHHDVWQWLSQTETQRNHACHNEKSSQDRIDEYRNRSRRQHPAWPEDQTWRPQHITSAVYQILPHPPLVSHRERKPKHRHPMSNDSSIIGGLQTPRNHPQMRHERVAAHKYSAAPDQGSEELFVPQCSSPPEFQPAGLPQFEKRPRHKTREDRYDNKKRKREQEKEGTTESRHKAREKSEKRRKRALVSTKNVMNNFASGAVLNDRITVGCPWTVHPRLSLIYT